MNTWEDLFSALLLISEVTRGGKKQPVRYTVAMSSSGSGRGTYASVPACLLSLLAFQSIYSSHLNREDGKTLEVELEWSRSPFS